MEEIVKNNYMVEITDVNGKKVKVEVNFEVWEFDKNDHWKQVWQKRKSKKEDSYENLCEIYAKNAIPKEFISKSKSSEKEFMEKYEKEKLWKAVNSLPEKQRRRIVLRFYYGLKISQIAKIENCSESSVKELIERALKNLRKNFQFFLL